MPKNRDQGIGLNGSVKNQIVAVLIGNAETFIVNASKEIG